MKTAFDRGREAGLESPQGVLPSPPHHYHDKPLADWVEGFCFGYLVKWHEDYFFDEEG